LAAFEVVVAGGTGHEVVAVAAVDDVVALAAAQVVVAGVAEDVVAARAAVHGVVACAGIDAVVSAAAHDEVVAGAAVGDDVDGDVGVDPDRVVAVAGADADLLPLGQRGRIAFAVDVDVDRTVLARAHVDAVVVRTAGRGVDDELVAGDAAAIDADIEGAFAPDLEAVARVQHVLLDRLAVRGGRILARYRIAVVAVDVRRCRTQRGGRREVRIRNLVRAADDWNSHVAISPLPVNRASFRQVTGGRKLGLTLKLGQTPCRCSTSRSTPGKPSAAGGDVMFTPGSVFSGHAIHVALHHAAG